MLRYGWQFDPDCWRQVPRDLAEDRAWRFVEFAEIESIAVPQGQPGVYALCTVPAGRRFPPADRSGNLFSNLLTPIYIGRTNDLQRRFLDHCRRPSKRIAAARVCFGRSMTFWYHRLASERLTHDEAVLIKCFGPPANGREETITAKLGVPISIGVPQSTNEERGKHR